MTQVVDATSVARFRAAITRCLGLALDDDLLPLAETLRRRALAFGAAPARYLDRLELGAGADEVGALARELTIGESYFFRHADQFRAFGEVALPDRLAARAASRQLRVLSAGCASGEEVYSLAIALTERNLDPGWDVAVRGVDVNPAALDRATRARYSTWSLRDVPPTTQRQWFVADGRELLLARERLRPTVTFELLNLVSDVEPWPPGSLDVIFCRNVLMYLTPAHATAVVARLARGLAPGGFLFLGHAETLRGLSHDFHLRQTHGAFYYQRKDEVASDAAPVRELAMPAASTASTAWIDAVQASAARISALAARASTPPERRAPDARATALELLQGERFEEALVVLDGGGRADADALLLRAVLLAHAGRAGEAESTCARVLALDELNAGAHYTLALCRESAGDREGAIGHDQAAIYLDPTFAMPRLHLGLLARRNGLADDARRALREATALFEREDAARLLLFGGGFSRDALIALCRAELAAAGGAS